MTGGWQRGPLIDFAALVSTGPFGSMLHKSDYVSDGVPLINPTNIVGESILPDGDKQVGVEALSRLSSYVLKAGDVVVGRRGEIGRCAVVGADEAGWVCGTGCFFIRPGSAADPHFLAWLLRSPDYRDQLERASTGATMKNMSNTTLAQLPVAIPEVGEQRRIVAILDEAFEAIATAKANAEKNLRSVASLLAQSIDELFQRPVLRQAPTFLLGELASFRNGINFDRHSNGESVRIVGVKDFQQHFDAPMNDLEWVVLDGQLSAADSVEPGDIVFVRSNGNPELIGRCLLIGQLSEPTTHSGFTIKMRLRGSSADPRFVCHFLKSTAVRRQLIDGGNGASIKSLNQGTLSAVRLPVPSLKEQSELVEQVEGLKQEAIRLASVYERKIAALNELKQSLLNQAFTGQL